MHHVVVHAHCYQPPREDPWLEVVETEPSASPDHDWNSRIDRECYARLAATEARVRDPDALPGDPNARAGLARIVNLYGWCTFDVGATLCEWMDEHAPATLRAMIAGDAASVRRWGHGNAIAAPYHHVILPLASPRDRRTEVRWGIRDFQRRFGRMPEGMWLPECAADEDTLDLIAAEGISFTILAPYQVRAAGETHGLPVRWRGASGRSLTILPYDGGLAGEVAFGGLLQNARALAARLAPSIADGQDRCTTLATDGETFGHHHRGGERTLLEAMARMAARTDARVVNAATIVATHPPTLDATLVSPSSWSCAHGIERWRSNCGCRIDQQRAPAQQWRGPLRAALTTLADACHAVFEREGGALFVDAPGNVRDQYGDAVAYDGEALAAFVRSAVRDASNAESVQRARELLEMERATLRMFTSCAWFFDDVERIETRQVLKYAARALELSGIAARAMPPFIAALESARANTQGAPTGAEVFTRTAIPKHDAAWGVAAGAMALAAAGLRVPRIAVFDVQTDAMDGSGRRVVLHHRRTGITVALDGVVHGAGPAVRVLLRERGEAPASARELTVADFPESVAERLLAPWALDDASLAG